MARSTHAGYAGEISAADTFEALADDPDAVLIDVRSAPEWEFVGRPDLSGLNRRPLLMSWQSWPDMAVDADFAARVAAAGLTRDQPVYLLCRSGQRSRAAAKALTAAGFGPCYNISDGFEGPKDSDGHRNTVSGWRQADLPWIQG